MVEADVHKEQEDEPDYLLDKEDEEEDEEEDIEDPDYEATEEGANVIGTLRVKVNICQAGNRPPSSG